MSLPEKCVVDTNVPIIANLATSPDSGSDVSGSCIDACINAIEHIIEKRCILVIDEGGEIFDEYLQHLSLKGPPGIGDAFMKWVNDHQWNPAYFDRVKITKTGHTYDEFPAHEQLRDFDISDRKFVAVANAHAKKPPILQATDSKWWGWKAALKEAGIQVHFLCPEYVREKHEKKMGI